MLTGFNEQIVNPIPQITNETIAQEMQQIGFQPTQQEQQQPNLTKVLQQQEDQAEQQLMTAYRDTHGQVTRDTQYKLQTLTKEYDIKKQSLETKYGRHNIHVDPETKKKYENELLNLNTQHALSMQRITDKIQPDLDELEMQRKQNLAQIQAGFAEKQIRLRTIQDMVDKGIVQNPTVALQEQYQTLGISMPLSEFQSQEKTPKQQLSDVQTVLRMLKSEIPKKTTVVNGELVMAGQAPPELLQQINNLEEIQKQLIPQVYPQYFGAAQNIGKLSGPVTRALVGDGQHGGTIAGRVTVAKNKNKAPQPTARERLQQLKSQGMSREEAIFWMRSNGY